MCSDIKKCYPVLQVNMKVLHSSVSGRNGTVIFLDIQKMVRVTLVQFIILPTFPNHENTNTPHVQWFRLGSL